MLSEESERRRAYLETVVQHIPAGLVIFDAETGAVTMANERAREIVGVGERRGSSPDEWTARAQAAVDASGRRPLDRALEGETIHGERVTVQHPDGRDVVLEMNAAPIRGLRGEVVAVGGALPGRHRAPRRGTGRRVEFVANAAHELRTPLAAIVSGVEVLEAGAKELPVERDRFLAHIAREAAAARRG